MAGLFFHLFEHTNGLKGVNNLKWLLFAIFILLLLILLILITKVNVKLNYYRGQGNDDLSIELRAWFGIIRYKIKIPYIKVAEDSPTIVARKKTIKGNRAENPKEKEEKKEKLVAEELLNSLNDTKVLLKHVVGLHKIIRSFLRKVKVRNLQWDTEIGIGDAAITGILIGAFWAVKGSLVSIVSHYMRLIEMPKIIITPNFHQAISKTRFQCMFQVRIGHAIFAAIKLVKFWKGGRPKFKSESLSILSEDKSKTV